MLEVVGNNISGVYFGLNPYYCTFSSDYFQLVMCVKKTTAEKMNNIKTNQTNASSSSPSQLHTVSSDRVISSQLPKFDAANYDFTTFRQRFEDTLELHRVNEMQKSGYLLSALDDNVYKILVIFCEPMRPREKYYQQLIDLLISIFSLYPAYTNRRRFYDAKQSTDENVIDWYTRVRKLAVDCSFGLHITSILTDRFICGLLPSVVFERVGLESSNKSLEEIVKVAVLEDNKGRSAKPLERSISIDLLDSDDTGNINKKKEM